MHKKIVIDFLTAQTFSHPWTDILWKWRRIHVHVPIEHVVRNIAFFSWIVTWNGSYWMNIEAKMLRKEMYRGYGEFWRRFPLKEWKRMPITELNSSFRIGSVKPRMWFDRTKAVLMLKKTTDKHFQSQLYEPKDASVSAQSDRTQLTETSSFNSSNRRWLDQCSVWPKGGSMQPRGIESEIKYPTSCTSQSP